MISVLINAVHTHTGGGLVYLNKILPHLAADPELDVTLVCAARNKDLIAIPPGMRVKALKLPGNFFLLHLWEQLALPILARVWGCKVTFCNANYAPLLAPKPVVVIHNNPAVAVYDKRWWAKYYWSALVLLTRVSLLVAPGAVTVSQAVVGTYARGIWKNLAGKITPARPGCDVMPDDGTGTRDADLVLAAGDFYVQKNYPLLLEAFAMLKQQRSKSRLLIVGRPLDKDVTADVHHFIHERNLGDSITLAGFLPQPELMKLYRRAAVFVSTSVAESFNIAVIEAMASGLPVVVADLPELRAEIYGEAAVYIPQDRGGDIAAAYAVALLAILENKLLADQLRQRGLKQAALFTWEATAAAIAGVIKRVGKKVTT